MNIVEINNSWAEDCIIGDDLFQAGRNVPKLHQKYFFILSKEALRLKKEKTELKELQRKKTEYYSAQMDPLEVKQNGWPLLNLKVLKADVPMYVESDKDVIEKSLQVGMIEEKVKYLEDIIRQIHSMNYLLKTMLDWRKFESGA